MHQSVVLFLFLSLFFSFLFFGFEVDSNQMWKVPKVPKVPKVRVLKLTCQVKHAMWKSGEKKRERNTGESLHPLLAS